MFTQLTFFKNKFFLFFLFILSFLEVGLAEYCKPPKDKNSFDKWLNQGHTYSCHIKDEQGLISRIEKSQEAKEGCKLPLDANSASGWNSKQSLISVIRGINEEQWDKIDKKVASEDKYVFHNTFNTPIGLVVTKGKHQKKQFQCKDKRYTCQKTNNYKLVFDKDKDNKCYLLTGYPVTSPPTN